MAELEVGFLFKRKYITYREKEYEIIELKDYVAAIKFTNTENYTYYNVLSGENDGAYAVGPHINTTQSDFIFLRDSLNDAIKSNENRVDFAAIKKLKLLPSGCYFSRTAEGIGIKVLRDKELISYLQSEEKKGQSDFDEEELKKASDISSMYSAIKKTIISQDEQIMQILTALFKNQKVINSNMNPDLIAKLKENILIYGSTGTGKTEILTRIAKIYNIPMVIEDATSLSETGYQGRNIIDMLEDLYLAADSNIKLAEKGILVIDEFDKLAEKSSDSQSHVSRFGVQR